MNPLFWELLGAIVRWALTLIGACMVQKHIITQDQSEAYSTAFAHDIVLAVPMIAALAWGLLAKYKSRIKFLAALSMPESSTENDVTAKINSGKATPSVRTPPNTVPGVPNG